MVAVAEKGQCRGWDSCPAPCLGLHKVLVGPTPLWCLVLGEPLLRLLIPSVQHWEPLGSNKDPWARVHRLCGREKKLPHPFWGEKWSHSGPTTVRMEAYGAASISQTQKLKWDWRKEIPSFYKQLPPWLCPCLVWQKGQNEWAGRSRWVYGCWWCGAPWYPCPNHVCTRVLHIQRFAGG